MNRLILLTLLTAPAIGFGCLDQWSPNDWVLNPDEDNPIIGLATSTDGSRNITLELQKAGEPMAMFTLERPKKFHTWLFNNCQVNRHHSPLVFAVAHVPKGEYGPRWTSKLTAAYRINLKMKKLEPVATDGIRCFIPN